MAGIEISGAFNNTAKLTNSIGRVKSVNTAYSQQHQLCCICNTQFAATSNNSNSICPSCCCCQNKANNYNIKQTHPLTLCLVVMMAFIVIMPHNVEAAAVRRHLTASAKSSETSAANMDNLLLLSAAVDELNDMEDINEEDDFNESETDSELSASASASSSSSSSSSSSADISDVLSPLEVMKHMQRREEYQNRRRSSLRKRQINHLENLRYLDGSSHHVEWHNPCNVAAVRETQTNNVPNMPRRTFYYLKKFKEVIRKEFITRHLALKHIRIDDMDTWRLHRETYAFLPKLRQNSNISLSRWYRNMQIFVASFTYLGRTQYKWDMGKTRAVSETTKELDQLISSARLILCELETTINGSHPNKNAKMLKSLSRDVMDEKLAFQTKEQQRSGAALVEPNMLDLKFAKDSYFKYLASMRKILKRKLKSKDHPVKMESSENDSEEVNATNNGGDDSEINFSSLMRSDSNMSLGESFELLMKTSSAQQPQQRKQKRTRKNNANRQSAQLPEV